MTDKPFKTVEEQIEILKSRNLMFLNEEGAKENLKRYGYYEIINGYKKPFLKNENDDDLGYKDGISFEHIFNLYLLDKNLRLDVLYSISFFEQNLKQAISNSISHKISEQQELYINPTIYNSGIHNERTRLLRMMERLTQEDTQPIKHYREKHQNIPPWILLKRFTLGQTIMLFRLISDPLIKEEIIALMLGIKSNLLSQLDKTFKIKQAFGDMLQLILDYRNLAAHDGRIYDHRSNKHPLSMTDFIYQEISISNYEFRHGKYRSSLGILIRILNLFDNPDPHTNLMVRVSVDMEKYLEKFPQDKDFLIQSSEVNVVPYIADYLK